MSKKKKNSSKKKRVSFFLLLIACCVLIFYLLDILPPTFSREIPTLEEPSAPFANQEEEPPAELPSLPDPENPAEEDEPSPEDSEPVLTVEENDDGLPVWEQSLIEQLDFLQSPIPGAHVSSRDSQLPGAPRTYRNGTHEGLDFYDGSCGVPIRFGDPVYAAGAGVVQRVDHQYTEFTAEERDELLRICSREPDTPAEILDWLRGRQVWIRHPNGVVTVYAHLSGVAQLQEGDPVEAGDLIGFIGNSGTSDGTKGNTAGAHLHFEVWIGEHYLGAGLPAAQSRKLLQAILE